MKKMKMKKKVRGESEEESEEESDKEGDEKDKESDKEGDEKDKESDKESDEESSEESENKSHKEDDEITFEKDEEKDEDEDEDEEDLHFKIKKNKNKIKLKTKDLNCPEYKLKATTGKWRDILPSHFKEMIFAVQTFICTYDIMLTIIKDYYKSDSRFQTLSKVKLKEVLINIYITISKQYKSRIIDIFNEQGKNKFSNMLRKNIEIEDVIIDENYYLTNIDIWLAISNKI